MICRPDPAPARPSHDMPAWPCACPGPSWYAGLTQRLPGPPMICRPDPAPARAPHDMPARRSADDQRESRPWRRRSRSGRRDTPHRGPASPPHRVKRRRAGGVRSPGAGTRRPAQHGS